MADFTAIPDDDHAALAALADGHLAEGPAAALRARMEVEPTLAEAFAAQQRVRSVIREAAQGVAAPLSLRERIDTQPVAQRRRRASWLALPGAALGALAVTAAAIVIAISGGAPSVTDTLSATSRAATIGVSIDPQTPQLLTIKQGAVTFPNFAKKFGWNATGARTDEIGGRQTTSVRYTRDGQDAVYTVVGGEALDVPEGSARVIEGRAFVVLRDGDRTVVTWERAGQTCVLSSTNATTDDLLELASWKGKGAVAF